MAKAREPENVQPFLSKMFAAVTRMETVNRCEIVAVYNERGEKLKLTKPVNINHYKVSVDADLRLTQSRV